VIAGRLRADPPCRLIDAWPDHVEAIRSGGLEVEYADETVRVALPAYHATELDEIGERPDIVLLAVKSNFTAESVERLLPHLADESIVVSLQNGINEDAISSLIGRRRTIGAAVAFGGELLGPGRARVGGDGLTVGELDGSLTPRVKSLAALLQPCARVAATENIWGYLWTKLVINTQLNAICAVTGYEPTRSSPTS
jgi:2-dehydropantoate 2-reductase